jgi:leader peptidase (prepilin peptidase)/N-methyltransferase
MPWTFELPPAAVSRAMGPACVKLAGVLGLLLGWLGWGPGIVWVFVTFILGGVIGAVLLLTGCANVQTRIPFRPLNDSGRVRGVDVPVQIVIG